MMARLERKDLKSLPERDSGPSLVTAIADELKKLRGGHEVELWFEARQLLAESFRSLEEEERSVRPSDHTSNVTHHTDARAGAAE